MGRKKDGEGGGRAIWRGDRQAAEKKGRVGMGRNVRRGGDSDIYPNQLGS